MFEKLTIIAIMFSRRKTRKVGVMNLMFTNLLSMLSVLSLSFYKGTVTVIKCYHEQI